MKKIIGLACLLVLVAALVVPMMASAATTPIGGTVTHASVTVTAPKAFTWTAFQVGWNVKSDLSTLATGATMGKVVVKAGTSGVVNATVTAKSPPAEGETWGPQFMWNGTTRHLDEELLISMTDEAANWHIVNGMTLAVQEITYSGPATRTLTNDAVAPGTSVTMWFPFHAAQWITTGDVDAGIATYSTVVEFTAACLP